MVSLTFCFASDTFSPLSDSSYILAVKPVQIRLAFSHSEFGRELCDVILSSRTSTRRTCPTTCFSSRSSLLHFSLRKWLMIGHDVELNMFSSILTARNFSSVLSSCKAIQSSGASEGTLVPGTFDHTDGCEGKCNYIVLRERGLERTSE